MNRMVSAAFNFDPDKIRLLVALSKRTGKPQTAYMREALDWLLRREGLLTEEKGDVEH